VVFQHLLDPFGEVVREIDERLLDHLLNPLATIKQSIGFFEPILVWNDLADTVLLQFALDEGDDLIRCHGIELDAVAKEEIDFFRGCAVSPQVCFALFFAAAVVNVLAFQPIDVGKAKTKINEVYRVMVGIAVVAAAKSGEDGKATLVEIAQDRAWNIEAAAYFHRSVVEPR
jgi:hypothetical protein